jgi:hypothetical protein
LLTTGPDTGLMPGQRLGHRIKPRAIACRSGDAPPPPHGRLNKQSPVSRLTRSTWE